MIDKNLNYAYPLRFAEGGAVPDWVDPDYGYNPESPQKTQHARNDGIYVWPDR
jgi:hypothetical protein